jgi:hypothetical protein
VCVVPSNSRCVSGISVRLSSFSFPILPAAESISRTNTRANSRVGTAPVLRFGSTAEQHVSFPRRHAHRVPSPLLRRLSAPAAASTPTTLRPHPSPEPYLPTPAALPAPAALLAPAAAAAPPRLRLASPVSRPRTSDEHLRNPVPRMARPPHAVSLQPRFRIESNADPSVLPPRRAVINEQLPPLFRLQPRARIHHGTALVNRIYPRPP